MKSNLQMSASNAASRVYWRGLDELAETPEFRQWVEKEFPAGASEFTDPVSRRHFVKIMSASFLLAGIGLTGCRRPEEKIFPFAKMPEGYTHGVPQWFATAMPVRGSAIPLIARSNDGRPTKVEGNALHPDSSGGTDCFAQASVLNLYDPDRAMRFVKGGNKVSREEAFDFLRQLSRDAEAKGGEGLCFLIERSSSPSRARLQKLIRKKFPQAVWFVHEPVDFAIHRFAATLAFDDELPLVHDSWGHTRAPYYRLDKAARILSLDCDFIGSEEDSHRLIHDFAKGRRLEKPQDEMSRLYVIESLFTLTGANADHRLRAPPSAVPGIAAKIAAEVLNAAAPTEVEASELKAVLEKIPDTVNVDPKWIKACALDLVENKGRALVLAGYRQPLAVHLIAHAMNVALGAVGRTVEFQQVLQAGQILEDRVLPISSLVKGLNDGYVDTLVILNANPAYSAPADLDWAGARRKAKTVVRLGYYEDETAAGCDWHFPMAHYLESWGDARTSDGTLVPIQPLIEPLFGGITELEFLGRICGFEKTGAYELVRETFKTFVSSADFEESWQRFLHDGFLADSAVKPVSVRFNWRRAGRLVKPQPPPSKDSLEVIFHRDYSVDDGRYSNNGWLQEMPDPITKMVWENVILLSKKTADDLRLRWPKNSEYHRVEAPLVKVSLDGREVIGPAWIQPGMADNVIGLALGYGRWKAGRVGNRAGYNAYRLRTSAQPCIATGATLSDTGRVHPLSTTQNHWAMEGRPIVREANLEQYHQHPNFAKDMDMPEPPGPKDAQGRPLPMYPNPLDIPGKDGKTPRERALHEWGMSIDLNACVGCAACVMACQSENNVPIVGKDQVGRNREMHWLRIDRYYAGSVEDPQAVNQPMLCQHCEAAPCENVCPVNATVHDEEGLNLMAYNRCVGTRYCSNNCPYKVRRFNYLDYNRRPLDKLVGPFYTSPLVHATDGEWDLLRWWKNPDTGIRPADEWELLKLVKNPDVTVRMRGVMEKCTFCLQRIEQAKIAQKVKAGATGDVEVPDGVIKTACQQACPADAIVFGNLKDPDSRVSQLKRQARDYAVLEFLETKPRATYLARVRNPNPAMPDYQEKPLSFVEWENKGGALEEHSEHGTGQETQTGNAAAKKGAH